MKLICTMILFTFLFFAATFNASLAQIVWTKDTINNPVLTSGSDGTWDDRTLLLFCILYDDTTYHMWYGGNDVDDISGGQIGYATSQDGIVWDKYEGNPVFDVGEPGSWEDDFVGVPCVQLVDDVYKMWYGGSDGTNSRMGFATSHDGITWTRYENNPVFDIGQPGSWNAGGSSQPCVRVYNDMYHMWFGGWEGDQSNSSIGYATSADGITWTEYEGNPILSPGHDSWDDVHIEVPEVYFDGNTYHMWYTGRSTNSWFRWRVGYATSTDGIEWKKYVDNPVLKPSPDSWDSQTVGMPSRIYFDSTTATFKMWYLGGDSNWSGGLGYATAPLSILDVPGQYATIQEGINAADSGDVVLVDEGTYYENINFKGKAITVASHYFFDGDTSHISKTIIDGSQPSNPDSGSVVYFHSGEDTSSVLCGLTITGGTGQNVFEPGSYDFRGAGGINFKNSGGRIISNKIINNTLSDDNMSIGGGIGAGFIGNEFWIILENNQIMNNSIDGINGAYGGGIFLAGNGRLVNNNISYNSCTATQSWAGGGGVHTDASPSLPCTVTIKDNQISHNIVQGCSTNTDPRAAFGGGIKIFRSKVSIINNEISFNQLNDISAGWGSGGGIYMYNAAGGSKIDGNAIHNNSNEVSGTKYGGGVGLGQFSGLSITNNIIYDNISSHGAGLSLNYNNAQIINNTIVDNTASSSGGGLYVQNSQPVVINSILWNNQAVNGAGIYPSSLNNVRYSDVQGGYAGEGNIDADPYFADTVYFYLSDSSNCIDAGDPDRQDPEDPQNPGSPLWPAMGTLRSDIGATGGYQLIDFIYNEKSNLPSEFVLFQNYPNPFNPTTAISYQLSAVSQVELSVYNLLGQKVAILVNERQRPGEYQVEWDARDFASGIYYYQLVAGEYREVMKMILLR